MPKKCMRVRERECPYMTSECKMAVKKKRKHAKMFARISTPENWDELG